MKQTSSLPRNQLDLLARAVDARSALFDRDHLCALRLFNGFYEGIPGLVLDLYGRTLVIANHASPPEILRPLIQAGLSACLERMPWLQAALLKTRRAALPEERNGMLIYGQEADVKIREGGVWYALDLQMNQDASFYLDTRNLRIWLGEHLRGRSLLNTFAYTGSLGAAALAGGARQVIQTDRSRKFLNLARRTYGLNGLTYREEDFPVGDFHRVVGALRREGRLFDCVVLDPPYFSASESGRVDLAGEMSRLINKVRPLVAHQGWLVAVNNALFVSGEDYLAELNSLCQDGYLSLEAILPVPADVTGYAETRVDSPPVDSSPFNHPTKITVMRVSRKDQAGAN